MMVVVGVELRGGGGVIEVMLCNTCFCFDNCDVCKSAEHFED